MLEQIPAWHVPTKWATIGPALAKAIERDPERDSWTVLDQAVSCDLDFWRVGGSSRGWMVTQKQGRVFWLIYAAGMGGSLADKRELMKLVETKAREAACSVVRFQGRDWRRVFPNYSAKRRDGRWHFQKRL